MIDMALQMNIVRRPLFIKKGEPVEADLTKILNQACSEFDIKVWEFNPNSRLRLFVDIKRLFIVMARRKYTQKVIGDFLGVDASTVHYHETTGNYHGSKNTP